MSGLARLAFLVGVLLVVPGASVGSAQPARPAVTHGVVVGDVTARSAVLWARADRDATLNVRLSGGRHRPVERVRVRATDDFTGQVPLEGLRAGTRYAYRVWFSAGAGEVRSFGARSGPLRPRTRERRSRSPSAATWPDRTSAATHARGSRS